MRRLKHAAWVGVSAFVITLVVGIGRGFLKDVWQPIGTMLFIAAAVGVVAAVLDACLYGKSSGSPKVPPASAARSLPARKVQPARTAIVFRQQIPPAHDPRHLSYFGGLPIAPPGFAWPGWSHDGKTEPLHFLMQIDCAAVTASGQNDGLPPRGVLYFFLDLRWGHSNGYRVLYVEDVTGPLAPAAAPADLAVAYGSEARYAWRWTEALDDPAPRCPSLLPKWPFDPVLIAIPPALLDAWRSEQDPENPDPVFWWPDVKAVHEVLLAAQESGAAAIAPAAERSGMTRPYPNYPQDWRAVEIGAALVLDQANRRFRYAESDHRLRALSAEARTAMHERIALEARQWLAQAGERAPFDAPPAPVRDAFWVWLQNWDAFTKFVIEDAARLAMEAALSDSAEAAARIPEAGIGRIRAGHALATRNASGIFASTPDRMLAPPSYVQGDQEETAQTHHLLLELSSNQGIGHYFGEGVYQFWITPDDLSRRRFDRVRLTTTAY